MYFSHITIGVTIFLFSANGFAFNPISRNGSPLFLSDRGWDNGNFLDALGTSSSAIDEANALYQKESQGRSAVRERRFQTMMNSSGDSGSDALFGGNVAGMPDKVPPVTQPNDEDNPMGGTRFRQMMEMAKKNPPKQSQGIPEPEPQMVPSSPQPVAPKAPAAPVVNAQAPVMDAQAIYQMQLQSWQQQMTFYSQLVAADPEAASKMTMPPPPQNPNAGGLPTSPVTQTPPQQPIPPQPLPPQPLAPQPQEAISTVNPADFAPKPVNNGNRDAYEITNPADVYFAQLKRDSTIRTKARKAGDIETANSAFADEGVKALSNYLSPELIKSRRENLAKNGSEFETSRDEMIIPYAEEEEVDKSYAGVSYRQKLQERMEKRKQD